MFVRCASSPEEIVDRIYFKCSTRRAGDNRLMSAARYTSYNDLVPYLVTLRGIGTSPTCVCVSARLGHPCTISVHGRAVLCILVTVNESNHRTAAPRHPSRSRPLRFYLRK